MAKAVASQAVEEHMARLAKEIERDQQPYLEFSVLCEALDAFSHLDQAFINTTPIPSPILVSDLTTITFFGDHLDDLKTGLYHPFITMDGSEDYCLAMQEFARNYTLLSERDFSCPTQILLTSRFPKTYERIQSPSLG
jgi:hypothetical protein